MKQSPVIEPMRSQSAHGYSGFPQDHIANFTSVAGYLIPVYWDFLDPGDKVNIRTLLRTKTAPLSAPAMATCIERIEWFAVPIDQLFRLFGTKYYGISDVNTDLYQALNGTPTAPYETYTDYLPYIRLARLHTLLKSFPTTFEEQSSIPPVTVGSVNPPTFSEGKRLCDALGLPNIIGSSSETVPGSISALPFAAYQKIWFDHYRLTDRDVNDPLAYNLDSYSGGDGGSSAIENDQRLYRLLTLRKRPYMRDYFTSMMVSPLMGSQDIGASGSDLGIIQQWLSGLDRIQTVIPDRLSSPAYNDYGGFTKVSDTNPNSVAVPVGGSQNSNGSLVGSIGLAVSALNPANIRSMFAVEKLLEVTRRAKKHYDVQTLAHFGVDVPKGLAGECLKLGTHEQYIQIGDVISQSDTYGADGGARLGSRAGLGASEGESKKISFEASCHCILMGIYSVEPVVNLMNEGTDRRLSMTNVSDFFKSEFDNLGMQPVFRRELFTGGYSTAQGSLYENSVIGWQPRYQQLKARYNRSFAGCSSPYFSEWSLNRTSIGNSQSAISRNFFYVWPTDLNNILYNQYVGGNNYATMYADDYFVNQCYFDITKASKKSVYGVPNL